MYFRELLIKNIQNVKKETPRKFQYAPYERPLHGQRQTQTESEETVK